jgi:hypothetical protein
MKLRDGKRSLTSACFLLALLLLASRGEAQRDDEGIATPSRPEPDVNQIRNALNSSDVAGAIHLMVQLHCATDLPDHVSEIRRFWNARNSPGAAAPSRNAVIQALMAQCLIEGQVDGTPKSELESAVSLLRSAILSQDLSEVLAGALGLLANSDSHDISSIASVSHRFPIATNLMAEAASASCASIATAIIDLMREQAPSESVRERILAINKRAEAQRLRKCIVAI